MITSTVNVRCRWSDGKIDTLYPLEVRDGEDWRQKQIMGLNREGWWHSFRHLGEVDDGGYAIFEEDPHAEKRRHDGPLPTGLTNETPDTTRPRRTKLAHPATVRTNDAHTEPSLRSRRAIRAHVAQSPRSAGARS